MILTQEISSNAQDSAFLKTACESGPDMLWVTFWKGDNVCIVSGLHFLWGQNKDASFGLCGSRSLVYVMLSLQTRGCSYLWGHFLNVWILILKFEAKKMTCGIRACLSNGKGDLVCNYSFNLLRKLSSTEINNFLKNYKISTVLLKIKGQRKNKSLLIIPPEINYC